MMLKIFIILTLVGLIFLYVRESQRNAITKTRREVHESAESRGFGHFTIIDNKEFFMWHSSIELPSIDGTTTHYFMKALHELPKDSNMKQIINKANELFEKNRFEKS